MFLHALNIGSCLGKKSIRQPDNDVETLWRDDKSKTCVMIVCASILLKGREDSSPGEMWESAALLPHESSRSSVLDRHEGMDAVSRINVRAF